MKSPSKYIPTFPFDFSVEGFLLVNEDTLVNSWNFGEENLTPTTVWHGNEHAITITSSNLNEFKTKPKDVMKSMLGILHAFQFLEQVLLSNQHPSFEDFEDLEVPPPEILGNSHVKRSAPTIDYYDDAHEESSEDYSDEEMTMIHGDLLEDMSIIDEPTNQTAKEWHINLFGEIGNKISCIIMTVIITHFKVS